MCAAASGTSDGAPTGPPGALTGPADHPGSSPGNWTGEPSGMPWAGSGDPGLPSGPGRPSAPEFAGGPGYPAPGGYRTPGAQPVQPADRYDPVDPGLGGALTELRRAVATARYPLAVAGAGTAGTIRAELIGLLDGYLLPRLTRPGAPLLTVLSGPTGAGKSTLLNSLIQAPVSPAGVLRPTTRSPVLVSNPTDGHWFSGEHLLPGLPRSTSLRAEPGSLTLISAPALPAGLALADAPDVDSVVEASHTLAGQLLDAADLWLFVTTAARYADAVPWDLLHQARVRGAVLALILNRVPPGAEDEIGADLAQMAADTDLAAVSLFVLPELDLRGRGLLPDHCVKPLRDWLTSVAADPEARAAVIGRTLSGAARAAVPAAEALARAADDQIAADFALRGAVAEAYRGAYQAVLAALDDTGTGPVRSGRHHHPEAGMPTVDFARTFGAAVRPAGPVTMSPTALASVIGEAAAGASERAYSAWQRYPAGVELLRGQDLAQAGVDLSQLRHVVESWRAELGPDRANGWRGDLWDRDDLVARVRDLLDAEASRFTRMLDGTEIVPDAPRRLWQAAALVRSELPAVPEAAIPQPTVDEAGPQAVTEPPFEFSAPFEPSAPVEPPAPVEPAAPVEASTPVEAAAETDTGGGEAGEAADTPAEAAGMRADAGTDAGTAPAGDLEQSGDTEQRMSA